MRRLFAWIIGIATFCGLASLAGQILGPVTCRDGWPSPSIGRQGACSHHGGVERGREWILLPVGTVAIFAGMGVYRMLAPGPVVPVASVRPVSVEEQGPPRCPGCGGMMRVRVARRGRRVGKRFWGCRRWPTCSDTRQIDK